MTTLLFVRPRRALAVAATLILIAAPARAQDRIEPAQAVRVVETDNPVTGGIARSVVPDPTPAEILRVQVELGRTGNDPGVRSGQLDGATRRALVAFQTDRGLLVCGCLTYETIVALGIRPQVVATVAVASGSAYGVVQHGVVLIDGGAIFLGHGRHGRRHRHRVVGPGVVVGHEPVFGPPSRPPPHRSGVGIRDPRPRPPVSPLRPGSSIRPLRSSPLGARPAPPRP